MYPLSQIIKSPMSYLVLIAMLLSLSCSKEGKGIPEEVQAKLNVSPKTLTLQVNETQALTIEVSPSNLKPMFVSLNPNVATIDDKGCVRGVAAGETKVQITLQDIVQSVKVQVLAKKKAPIGNQLPILLFAEDHTDPKIADHEARIGRTEGLLVPASDELEVVGYANKDLVITTAAYGQASDRGRVIIAGCSESLGSLTETREMLKEYGFDSLELRKDPDKGHYYSSKNAQGIEVILYRANYPEYNVRTLILFVRTRFGGSAEKEHNVVTSVADFPSYMAFLKGGLTEDEIKTSEDMLGFRSLAESPKAGTLLFNTKPGQLDKTNVKMAFYVASVPDMPRYIRLQMICAEKISELLDLDFQQYLGVNGFGRPIYVKSQDFVYADCIKDPTIYVAFYIQPATDDLPPFMLAEISQNQTPKSNMSQALKRVSQLKRDCCTYNH